MRDHPIRLLLTLYWMKFVKLSQPEARQLPIRPQPKPAFVQPKPTLVQPKPTFVQPKPAFG